MLLALSFGFALCTQLIRLTALLRLFPLELQLWDHPSINRDFSNNTLSACLLLYDDNHFLTEWLAFHYQTLPMRRLIVASDPRSRTSPSTILNRWQPFINITEWTDDDFFPLSYRRSIFLSRRHQNSSQKLVLMHRYRQRFFYLRCMRQLRREHEILLNRTGTFDPSTQKQQHRQNWAIFIDVDEFIFPNRNWKFHFLLPPRQVRRVTIAQLLFRLQNLPTVARPCLGLPRLLFGTYKRHETNDSQSYGEIESLVKDLPDVIRTVSQTRNLLTWTWRWHGKLQNHSSNKAGKALMDLGMIPFSAMRLDDVDVHRPVMNCCTLDNMWIHNIESPFVLHHYVGTLRQFTFRDDPRREKRTVASYAEYQNVNSGTVNLWDSRIWFLDFVQTMGEDQARYLLQGAGEIEKNASPMLSEDESYRMLKMKVFDGDDNATSLFPFRMQRSKNKI